MRSRHWKFRASLGTAFLLLVGCHSYSPYGGYPGHYQGAPGGVVMPQGNGYPQPIPGSPHGPVLGPSQSVPGDGWEGSSPPLNSQPGNFDAPSTYERPLNGAGNNPVPDYPDNADAFDAPPMGGVSPGDSSSDPMFDDDARVTPFRQRDDTSSNFGVDDQRTGSLDIRSNSPDVRSDEHPVQAGSTVAGRPFSAGARQAGHEPYDYDHADYRWLRGVAHYDQQHQTWHVMYSRRPDGDDHFGGDIGLSRNASLNGLKNNQLVYVEGHVNPDDRDFRNKPRFDVSYLEPQAHRN